MAEPQHPTSGGSVGAATAAYRYRKLGSVDARPKVVAFYSGMHGWSPANGGRLDPVVAQRWIEDGLSQVRVRRGLKTVEISLRRYLGAELSTD